MGRRRTPLVFQLALAVGAGLLALVIYAAVLLRLTPAEIISVVVR